MYSDLPRVTQLVNGGVGCRTQAAPWLQLRLWARVALGGWGVQAPRSRRKFALRPLPTHPALEVAWQRRLASVYSSLVAALGLRACRQGLHGLSSRTFPRKGQRSVPNSRHSVQRHPQGRMLGLPCKEVLDLFAQLPLPLPCHSGSDTLGTCPLSLPLPSSLSPESQEHTHNSAMHRRELQSPAVWSLLQAPAGPPGRQVQAPPPDSPL